MNEIDNTLDILEENQQKLRDLLREKHLNKKRDWLLLSLRLPPEIVEMIDKDRSKKGYISRNAWIFQRILDALETIK